MNNNSRRNSKKGNYRTTNNIIVPQKEKSRYAEKGRKKDNYNRINRHINLVGILFFMVLIYLIVNVVLNNNKMDINYIYAEPGKIYNEGNFKGVLLKKEEIVYANESGSVSFFVPEGKKVRQNSYICAIGKNEETEKLINKQINNKLNQLSDAVTISEDDYVLLQDKIRTYVYDKEQAEYEYLYREKDLLKASINDISNAVFVKDPQLFASIQKEIESNEEMQLSNGSYYKMANSGIVGYTIDGFEEYSIDNYDYTILNKKVSKVDLAKEETIEKGEPLYKIINNYLFYVLVKIDDICAKRLEEKRYVTLHFPRKTLDIDAKIYSVEKKNDNYYAVFEIDRYFNYFFNDRFVNIRIEYDNYSGIKIPNDAVAKKTVFKIPKTALFEKEGNTKVNKIVYNNKNEISKGSAVNVKVYDIKEDYAYINIMSNDVSLGMGDKIFYSLSSDNKTSELSEFVIDTKESIDGVYVVNKGFADFKKIKTVYNDEDFRIIENNIGYSISVYDKIAANANIVKEFEKIN